MSVETLDPQWIDYQTPGLRHPWWQRNNLRLIIFIGVVAVVVGYPLWVFVDASVSGGIKDAGGGYKEVDLKAMSLFWFDQQHGTQQDVPAKWRALDGQKI